jgi:RNA-binding protein
VDLCPAFNEPSVFLSATNSLDTNEGKHYSMRVPTELTGSHKRQLRALAQKLDAHLKVGRNGLSAQFIASTNEMLTQHELIKVRFTEFKDQRKELAAQLAEKTDSVLIASIGHVISLYRPAADPETSKIRLRS